MSQQVFDSSLPARSPVIGGGLLELLNDPDPARLKSVVLEGLVPETVTGTLPFKLARAFDYALVHCRNGNDCPDAAFPLDCTHFLCHCLHAAGVKVSQPGAECASKLCIRANDLAAALYNTVGKYTNVKQIGSHGATRRGDICFIPSWFGLSKVHAMLLAGTATADGAAVYAHTNNRCGELVQFEGAACAYYRIEDA